MPAMITGGAERRPSSRPLSYAVPGATRPGEQTWTQHPAGFRVHESTVRIGAGRDCWEAATSRLLRWGVKTSSGFAVEPALAVGQQLADQEHYWLLARLGPVTVREPVRVVAVVDAPDRCGFAYGTLRGHPVSGEEAFVVHRTPDQEVRLTLRSLTRASEGAWRLALPALLVAQRAYRRRYRRALLGLG